MVYFPIIADNGTLFELYGKKMHTLTAKRNYPPPPQTTRELYLYGIVKLISTPPPPPGPSKFINTTSREVENPGRALVSRSLTHLRR
jgi:hypothetical protein